MIMNVISHIVCLFYVHSSLFPPKWPLRLAVKLGSPRHDTNNRFMDPSTLYLIYGSSYIFLKKPPHFQLSLQKP